MGKARSKLPHGANVDSLLDWIQETFKLSPVEQEVVLKYLLILK